MGGALTPIFSDPKDQFVDTLGTAVSGYSYETLAQLVTQLAGRLHDPTKVYWTDAELKEILTEAFRTFNLLTWHWRTQTSFSAVGAHFFDLSTTLPLYLGRTLTDRQVINDIQYHFQEAITTNWAGGWTGTGMFTMDDVSHCLQKRRNRFLAETGCVITRTVADSGFPNGGRIILADNVIDVRRLARLTQGSMSNLWRVSEEELTAFGASWATTAAQDPSYFSVMSTQPVSVQLAPAPTQAALLDLLTVSNGSDFTPTTAATLMGVPDDMAWIVKWGAMADLLQKDGPAQDLARSEYCEKRYQHGVQLARATTVLLGVRINGTPVPIATLAELDAYEQDWQYYVANAPDIVATAGLNYIALYPAPGIANTITLDIIRNAMVPVLDTDYIQLGREMVSMILDYSVHLAMFKVGGAEWQTTQQLFSQFLSMTSNYNRRMEAASRLWKDMNKVTNAEEATRLRIKPEAPTNA
jgi:hypothetical protein